MPELPEVETTRLGLMPVLGQTISHVEVRHHGLRWPVPPQLPSILTGLTLHKLERRAKYILATMQNDTRSGTLLLHLGMSGRLCLLEQFSPPEKHDHLDIGFGDGRVVRLRDPRRFGAVLWLDGDVNQHPLLATLGPEPLQEAFNARYLHHNMRTRTAAIKTTIMNAHLVVGVGNIYASESLFRARIAPQTPANQLTLKQCERLVEEIKATLSDALKAGGSSLRDFFGADGNPGYFQQSYFVYGRTGEPCRVCGKPILSVRQGQRSTFYCGVCQKASRSASH
ncbi:bifunctional DNA-formamidopyrimidine glycosylase/DNA-(apurinic or apyrimidinic site) lyase [Methylotenera sp. 1P/1]|uniref:bifunctional DNA-formamidopyrimidine glycosylase/DNA-(apurinic or apyrimidinic site) lyase n=1 Tax=Methylotenera sp. 1P/1 TaxID=1131551 RepID=UPI000366B780|nr:bifunctional DNA-formamidopyrimidine glycosylase/DNA-(apurinic or apyrimidinic site) lyase [Methylotenera sp. 1P/1]